MLERVARHGDNGASDWQPSRACRRRCRHVRRGALAKYTGARARDLRARKTHSTIWRRTRRRASFDKAYAVDTSDEQDGRTDRLAASLAKEAGGSLLDQRSVHRRSILSVAARGLHHRAVCATLSSRFFSAHATHGVFVLRGKAAVDLTAPSPIEHPVFVVKDLEAKTVKIGGATLVADVDYFATVDSGSTWITLNRTVSGTTRIEVE
jgi:hypothetical protein